MAPSTSRTSPLAVVALRTSAIGAGSVADTVVPELSLRAVQSSSNADAVVEVISCVTGIAEGVGETAEAVAGTVLADSVVSIRVGS